MNIIEVCHTHQAKNILATVRDHVFLDKFDPHIVDFYGKKKEDDNFSIGPVYEHLKHDPTGMLIYTEKHHLEALTSALNDLDQKIINHWNWGEPVHVIELMNTAMNKWVAIEKIANKFDISRDRILAFGDGANDLEMIGNAGIGVAMENAVAPLQSIAKYHTASNEEHGVAQFLNDYFNLKQNIFAI